MKTTELKLKRIYLGEYTIGRLSCVGVPICDTLEDKVRPVKIKHETAIPTGRYEVLITWSDRFKKPMPILLNVEGFEGIRIHSGNTISDTSGCILVGENKEVGKVINSRIAFTKVFAIIQEALQNGGKVYITIE